MHNAALLARENDQLRESNNRLQKRQSRRTRALPNTGILTVAEGRELAAELHEAVNPPRGPMRMSLWSSVGALPQGVLIAGK